MFISNYAALLRWDSIICWNF